MERRRSFSYESSDDESISGQQSGSVLMTMSGDAIERSHDTNSRKLHRNASSYTHETDREAPSSSSIESSRRRHAGAWGIIPRSGWLMCLVTALVLTFLAGLLIGKFAWGDDSTEKSSVVSSDDEPFVFVPRPPLTSNISVGVYYYRKYSLSSSRAISRTLSHFPFSVWSSVLLL